MKGSLSDYHSIRISDRVIYVRRDALIHLSQVEAIIFDCDGVLIDTRRSYDATIVRTARLILSRLVGVSLPSGVITPSIIYALRSSGGFNNDWDSTYVILLYLFSRLPKRILERFAQSYPDLPRGDLKLNSRSGIRGAVRRMHQGLSRFVEQADSSGIDSLERVLLRGRQPSWRRVALRSFKEILGYPQRGAESLLATVFDEIFYGPALFEAGRRRRPQFYLGAGAIEKETPIVTQTTLQQLADRVSTRNLGIASGRGTLAIAHTLGSLLDYFNPRARVLLEDEELKAGDNLSALRIERAKPAPYALLQSARPMKKFERALYVGDSAEDVIMTRRANELDPRYLFAGVTEYGYDSKRKRQMFAEAAADLIMPSVNQLPELLQLSQAARKG